MPVATMPKSGSKSYWKFLAAHEAKHAHENLFSSRRGVYLFSDVETSSGQSLCIYNNNPYQDFKDGVSEQREEETTKLRIALKKAGLKELAYETYPAKGDESAGYTFAMFIDATDDDTPTIHELYNEILRDSNARCIANGAFRRDRGIQGSPRKFSTNLLIRTTFIHSAGPPNS